jgi:hypothetical protein
MAGRAALLAVPCTRGVEIRIQPVNGRDEHLALIWRLTGKKRDATMMMSYDDETTGRLASPSPLDPALTVTPLAKSPHRTYVRQDDGDARVVGSAPLALHIIVTVR